MLAHGGRIRALLVNFIRISPCEAQCDSETLHCTILQTRPVGIWSTDPSTLAIFLNNVGMAGFSESATPKTTLRIKDVTCSIPLSAHVASYTSVAWMLTTSLNSQTTGAAGVGNMSGISTVSTSPSTLTAHWERGGTSRATTQIEYDHRRSIYSAQA